MVIELISDYEANHKPWAWGLVSDKGEYLMYPDTELGRHVYDTMKEARAAAEDFISKIVSESGAERLSYKIVTDRRHIQSLEKEQTDGE